VNIFQKNIQKPGFVFAYPTEAVYGLGCNPFDEKALDRIRTLKQRAANQHFILIASNWEQITPLIQSLEESLLEPVKASWPGPITWVFPAASNIPETLKTFNTIALRLTAHPIAKKLCDIAGHALVSTSANISGHPPCRTAQETQHIFGAQLDQIIPGNVELSQNPTPIRDVLTGEWLRR